MQQIPARWSGASSSGPHSLCRCMRPLACVVATQGRTGRRRHWDVVTWRGVEACCGENAVAGTLQGGESTYRYSFVQLYYSRFGLPRSVWPPVSDHCEMKISRIQHDAFHDFQKRAMGRETKKSPPGSAGVLEPSGCYCVHSRGQLSRRLSSVIDIREICKQPRRRAEKSVNIAETMQLYSISP